MAQQGELDDTADEERPYQVVARRFRPHTFAEMVGQDDVLQSLRMALSQHRVPHAFLFSGSRGVGKTTSARILARCLNCEQGPTPESCGECAACRSILDGSNPDVLERECRVDQGDRSPRPPTDPDVRDVALPAPQITGLLRDDKSNEQREPTVEDTAR